MRNHLLSLAAVTTMVVAVSAQAQTQDRSNRARSGASPQRGSDFYTKGPNAPFKNQQRKFTDPLNAKGR